MRICYVSSNSGPHSERFIKKMEIRHEVHYVSFRQVPPDFQSRHPSVRFHVLDVLWPNVNVLHGFIENLKGSTTRRLLEVPKYLFRYTTSIVRAWVFLRDILRKFKPDVLFGGWIQREGLVCALTNYHPFLLMPWGSDALILPFENPLLRIGSEFVIRRADKITCDAEEMKNSMLELVKMDPTDIVVFPWGVEQDVFDSSIDGTNLRRELGWENDIIILNTRGFYPEYDPFTFLSTLPTLSRNYPRLRIVMTGTGELEKECHDFIELHGLGERVHFAGYVNKMRLVEYYAAADIFVSTSVTDGTPISLLEAMTMSLPIVISELPAIKEWIKHGYNGLLFPVGNRNKLQSNLELLIGNEDMRKIFARRNREIAMERANWDDNYEKLERIFADLVSG